jgi:hypothetical protein
MQALGPQDFGPNAADETRFFPSKIPSRETRAGHERDQSGNRETAAKRRGTQPRQRRHHCETASDPSGTRAGRSRDGADPLRNADETGPGSGETRSGFSALRRTRGAWAGSVSGIGLTDPTTADPGVSPSSLGATTLESQGGVRLVPVMPPGRCTRKALPFAHEIHRLYATGYTLEAIRQALSAAGVTVSRSTVHREVARARKQPSATSSTDATQRALNVASPTPVIEATPKPEAGETPSPPVPAQSPGKPGQTSFANGPRGEDVAKAFMSTQITNTFMREKEQR